MLSFWVEILYLIIFLEKDILPCLYSVGELSGDIALRYQTDHEISTLWLRYRAFNPPHVCTP